MIIKLTPFAVRRLDRSDEAKRLARLALVKYAKEHFGALVWREVEHLYVFSDFDDHRSPCTRYASCFTYFQNQIPVQHAGSPTAGAGWPAP